MAVDARSTYWAELLTKDWEAVSDAVLQYSRFGLADELAGSLFKSGSDHSLLPSADKVCFLNSFDAQRAISAELDIVRGVGTFVDRWSAASQETEGTGENETSLFAESERNSVLRFTSSLLVKAGDTSLPDELKTVSAFEAKYINSTNKPVELQDDVIAKAKERLAKTCDELVIRGQATRPTDAQEKVIALAKGGDQAAIDELVNSNLVYVPEPPASEAS